MKVRILDSPDLVLYQDLVWIMTYGLPCKIHLKTGSVIEMPRCDFRIFDDTITYVRVNIVVHRFCEIEKIEIPSRRSATETDPLDGMPAI